MRKFSRGELKDSHGKTVTDRDQALAIALSEAGLSNAAGIAEELKRSGKYVEGKTKVPDLTELQKGISIEMEHTDDAGAAKQIVLDHLVEDPKYYSKLTTIENVKIIKKNSLTYSGHKLQGRTTFQDFEISIEQRKGSVRTGTDPDGKKWRTKFKYPYGYIKGTVGVDKDHVDCYIGGNEDAENAYIIHQNKPTTGRYDEDKIMLGFDSPEKAKKAYEDHYDKPGFFGDMRTVPMDQLGDLLERRKGKKL
jgi:hypothetical protein